VATSGDTFKFVEIDGVRYSHIMNPATGIGLTERVGVTIVAPDCMTADALASAVSVMGMHKGLELVSAVDDVAARIVTLDDGTPTVTQCPRFADLPRWLPDAETDEPLQ